MKIWLLSLLSPSGKGQTLTSPLWKRGARGDFKNKCFLNSETGKAKDRIREDALREMGIKVLRFSDRDVFENMGGVMEGIWSCL
jgi:hypothetical protein